MKTILSLMPLLALAWWANDTMTTLRKDLERTVAALSAMQSLIDEPRPVYRMINGRIGAEDPPMHRLSNWWYRDM